MCAVDDDDDDGDGDGDCDENYDCDYDYPGKLYVLLLINSCIPLL